MRLNCFFIILSLVSSLILSCNDAVKDNIVNSEAGTVKDLETSDWTIATHSNSADPDYKTVFPQDQVNRIDLVISDSDWQLMLDDMTQKYGNFGSSSGGGGPHMQGGSDENPVYVPCSVFFTGREWYKVGVRFKGNSSLRTSWGKGIWKIPLRLNFDRHEDEYPEIANQRFYGFKELSLSSNYDDRSLIREKIVPEIFRDFGVPAPQTAFYRIYINYGDGPEYFGLYTMVEIIEDTMIEDHFNEDDGNVYKPEGTGASFAYSTFNESDFEKKTNEGSDWTDINTLYDVLHSTQRTSDSDAWRISLEKVFNVDGFLKWLAVNITVQNWDTYGRMTHNYYLYFDPKHNWLTWIPWDNNEALQNGKQGGSLSISCNEVNSNWPLIRYLLDEDEYLLKYKTYLNQIVETAFEPSKMTARYQYYYDLVRDYVIGAEGEQENHTFLNSDSEFDSALNFLISHVNSRYNVVKSYF